MARLDIFAVPGVEDASSGRPVRRPDLQFVEGAAWVARYHDATNTYFVAVRPENVISGRGPSVQSKKARRADIEAAFGVGAVEEMLTQLTIGEDRPDDGSVSTTAK